MSYRIAVLHDCYTPDLQGQRRPVIKGDVYDTVDDARAEITRLTDGPLYIDNNIYGVTYLVVNDVTADYIESGRNGDMSNYDWDNNDCTSSDQGQCCGECRDCITMMIDQDRECIRQNAET